MKLVVVFILLTICSACTSAQQPGGNNSAKIRPSGKQPVLVELFTSEGCSSCPPADRLLATLAKDQPNPDAEIVTLALHVTYWDDLGWKDEFSSALFTQRQDIYSQRFRLDSVYTPQMVIDGSYQTVGSDAGRAEKLISEAAKAAKAKIDLSGSDVLRIKISDIPEHRQASVYIAVVEDNLASDVRRGENSGKRLDHSAVARLLQSIGSIDTAAGEYSTEFKFPSNDGWHAENVRYICFIQENESRKILGVSSFRAA